MQGLVSEHKLRFPRDLTFAILVKHSCLTASGHTGTQGPDSRMKQWEWKEPKVSKP